LLLALRASCKFIDFILAGNVSPLVCAKIESVVKAMALPNMQFVYAIRPGHMQFVQDILPRLFPLDSDGFL
jgi:hypothetical protein